MALSLDIVYDLEEFSDLLVSKKPRQRLWKPEQIAAFYRIFDLDILFFLQVFVEGPDAVEITVDRLRMQPPVEKTVDKREDLSAINLFNGTIDPDDELLERAHIVPDSAPGVVPSSSATA